MTHIELGKWGEEIASDYLKKKGFEIIEKNWRYQHLEIDLVARKDNVLVFVEVKTRSGIAYGYPEQSISGEKAVRLIEAAHAYIENNAHPPYFRFDVISIMRSGNNYELKHFEDAISPQVE